jgi:putative ABC transport system substrate-binding protein
LRPELVALKVDVIVVGNTPAALAAKQATRTLPIVFAAAAADPVTSGLVTSLARPDGNVTGVTGLAPELVGKCLDQLKQAVPGVSRVAVLWHPGASGEGTDKDMLKGAEVAARALGVRLQLVETRGPEDFDRAFPDMIRARAEALTVVPSACSSMSEDASWTWRQEPAAGRVPIEGVCRCRGLMSYGPNVADLFRRAAPTWTRSSRARSPATYRGAADEVRAGHQPQDRKALGLTIPPSLLGGRMR